MQSAWLFFVCIVPCIMCIEHDFKGFDDSILFGLNWPGAQELDNLIDGTADVKKPLVKEVLKVKTSNKETYECHIPDYIDNEPMKIEDYEGPTPLQLLKPLFTQKICSFRLESYWSYEVCHGRYIRQYHEERDGKQIKTQEYYLGHWSTDKQLALEAAIDNTKDQNEKPKLTKVEGTPLPYVELVMTDGTVCDLSGKPRLTKVLYVCYSHGKHEVYSFKEISTCEYEIIVLSPLLCEHPHFKPKDTSENIINCRPLGDAPTKPRSLLAMEAESLKLQHQTVRLTSGDKEPKDVVAVLKVEKFEKDGETHLKFELHPLSEEAEDAKAAVPQLADQSSSSVRRDDVLKDDSPVRAFLNGENCLNGGTGWWKYEFCYGKYVSQYHVDRSSEKIEVLLGRFNEQEHLDWIRENQAKAPKPVGQRTSISHFYSNGEICDKTGKPRQTEVKLKCLENSSTSAQVSLYLLEPRTCHYILGVESPLICDILPLADENGLIKSAKLFDDEVQVTNDHEAKDKYEKSKKHSLGDD